MSIHEPDVKTLAIIRRLAEERGCTVEELLSAALRSLPNATEKSDPILGIFADEPDLMDEIVRYAFDARKRPLRHAQT